MPANRTVTELETYSGRYLDFVDPQPKQVVLVDIAAGLANTCRFGGQVSRWFSVAEHAIIVSHMVSEELALPALHHDSHEAYLGDLIAPFKATIALVAPNVIREISDRIDVAIADALDIDVALMKHPEVKAADDESMYREAAALKWSHGRGRHWNNWKTYVPLAGIGWSPQKAERMFVQRHEELMKGR